MEILVNPVYAPLGCHQVKSTIDYGRYKTIVLALAPLILDVFQFIAIKGKNLKVARIALIGHLCILVINVVYFLIFISNVSEKIAIIERSVLIALHVLMVVFGSFKVCQSLSAKQIQLENYQGYYNA